MDIRVVPVHHVVTGARPRGDHRDKFSGSSEDSRSAAACSAVGPPKTTGKLTVATVTQSSYGGGKRKEKSWIVAGPSARLEHPAGNDRHVFLMSTCPYERQVVCFKESEAVVRELGNEPVEISMYFSPDDWTEASLAALVSSYQDRVRAIGAAAEDVLTQVERLGDGSARVRVSWDRRGTVMDPMTGEEIAGGPDPEGSKPALVMYTDEDGETFIEVQDEHSIAPPGPVGMRTGEEHALDTQKLPGVPWTWFVVVGVALLAAAGGIGWIRRKISNSVASRDAH